jgi:hypothetical protein
MITAYLNILFDLFGQFPEWGYVSMGCKSLVTKLKSLVKENITTICQYFPLSPGNIDRLSAQKARGSGYHETFSRKVQNCPGWKRK